MFSDRDLVLKFNYLTAPQAALRRMKITEPTKEFRYRETWHELPLPSNWAVTIGSWGGVKTVEEIQQLAGVTYGALKQFRQRNLLSTARTENNKASSWKLALSSYQMFGYNLETAEPERVTMVAHSHGILPFELYLYVHMMESVWKEMKIKSLSDLNTPRGELAEIRWPDLMLMVDMAIPRKYAR